MKLSEIANQIDSGSVFISGAVGGMLSWALGDKKRNAWEALAIVCGGAFAAEYLTEAILTLTGWKLPDRAIGFMLGVLGMRALDVAIGVLEQFAANPKELFVFIINYITSKFRK
jgi:hypothetical protein